MEEFVLSELSFLTSLEAIELIENDFLQTVSVGRGKEVISIGEKCKHIFLIMEGSVRQFGIKDGEEINFLFYFKEEFFFDELSFYEQIPTKYTFKTLEDSTFLKISKKIFERYPEDARFEKFLFKLSRQNVTRLYKRNEVLLMDTAEERYLKLLEVHPLIMEKVSLAKIASFIGIAPPSLSRIRRRLTKA